MILRLPNPMAALVWLAFLAAPALLGAWSDRLLGAGACALALGTLFLQPSPWEKRAPSGLALRVFLLLELLYLVSALYSAGFNGSAPGPWEAFEPLRYVLLGAFTVYLIRHYDSRVRAALEWAAVAAAWGALLLPAADPQGFLSALTLCWLLFFSRLRLRFAFAAAAALAVAFGGGPVAWTAGAGALAAALCLPLRAALARRRVRRAGLWSLLLFVLLLTAAAAVIRASPAGIALRGSSEAVAWQFVRRSPVFGWGPISSAAIVGRSQYVFWLLKGGVLGAGVILVGFLLAGSRLLASARGDVRRLAGAAVFCGAVALMLASGRFFESYRLFILTAVFAAAMQEEAR